MSTSHQEIIMSEQASKIFVFEQVHSFEAAQKKAEDKKVNAFGMMAKLNILNRPKASTVQLTQMEQRLEPFWHIEAHKTVDYDHESVYQVNIPNPYVHSVEIEGETFEVARDRNEASVNVSALEKCYRKIYYNKTIDGLNRYIESDAFLRYSEKFKFHEVKEVSATDNMIQPLLPQLAAIQHVCNELNSHPIDAHVMHKNVITFDKVHLFLVPVYAFEFAWEAGGKTGVIEVNGLTGEIKEDGQWFKEKIEQLFTREALIESSLNIDNELISTELKDVDETTAKVNQDT